MINTPGSLNRQHQHQHQDQQIQRQEMKTALVTGANSGIGLALSLELQQRGYKVYATDLRFSPETTERFNDNVSCHVMDVTSNEQVQQVRDIVASENNNSLDLLYCNAGRAEVALAVDMADDQIRSLYELNLFANMRLAREFSKLVVNAQGTMAFSGSVTKSMPIHSNALYSSSKAALDQYIAVLQCEMRNYGVKVIDVVGGYVKTSIFASGVAKVKEGSVFDFKEYTDIYSQRGEKIKNNTEGAMDPAMFAKRVIDKLEKATVNTLRIYEGTKSSTLDWTQKLLPAKVLVDKMLSIFDLDFDYRKHLEQENK